MADPRKAIIVAGNYRSGTTWLAEMLTAALPGHALLFEPIRAYYLTMARAGIVEWRPYITAASATEAERAAFQEVFSGGMVYRDAVAHTSHGAVVDAEALVIKMVRGLMSLRWMVDEFRPRHTFVIMRHPCAAIASQLRVGAIPGTPKDPKGLDTFWAQHPELERFVPQTDVEWLATWWAASYYAALSTPKPHPWTFLRYEDLVDDPYAVQAYVFKPLGLEPPKIRELVSKPSQQTKRDTGSVWQSKAWTHRVSPQQSQEIWGVIERFPGLMDFYDAP